MKAISAVIATIMLLMISVSLISVFYVFSSTMVTTTTGSGSAQASQLTKQLSTCVRIDNTLGNQITITNCGTGIITNDSLAVFVDDAKLKISMNTIPENSDGVVNITELPSTKQGSHNLAIKNGIGSDVKTYSNIPRKGTESNPGASCADIFSSGFLPSSGIYWIAPAGTKFQAYCDMSSMKKGTQLNPAASCNDILMSGSSQGDGMYWISSGGSNSNVYCDMTTDGGGWTLVWVGTGKTWSNTLLSSYTTKIDRNDISNGTTVSMQTKLIEKWPYYTQIYYERWLPASLTGRSYAAPGWAKRSANTVSATPTNMNFWSASRTNAQGWDFSLGNVCGSAPEPVVYWNCHQMPNGNRKRHIWGCWGCASNYLWFQDASTQTGAWNGFFPDYTYGYWRISTMAHYDQQWPEYNALSEGNPMPGYGLYVR